MIYLPQHFCIPFNFCLSGSYFTGENISKGLCHIMIRGFDDGHTLFY